MPRTAARYMLAVAATAVLAWCGAVVASDADGAHWLVDDLGYGMLAALLAVGVAACWAAAIRGDR